MSSISTIQRFDFIEVEHVEDLIFPENILSLGRTITRPKQCSHTNDKGCMESLPRWQHNLRDPRCSNVTNAIPDPLVLAKPSSADEGNRTKHRRRASLRIKIDEVATSLAPIEVILLEGIVEQGDDSQVALAQERLVKSFAGLHPDDQAKDKPIPIGS
jgi:hypothetical protein